MSEEEILDIKRENYKLRKENFELIQDNTRLVEEKEKLKYDLLEVTHELGIKKQRLENSISKDKIREKIKIIESYSKMAKEEITERIVVADSNSLNYGRKEAHNADLYQLKELLGGEE